MAPRVPTDHAPGVYDRVTTLEIESQPTTTTTGGPTSGAASLGQKFFDVLITILENDIYLFFTIFCFAVALFTVMYIVTPIYPDGQVFDSAFRPDRFEFHLDSVVISEFQASPTHLTGKCHVSVTACNLYHTTMFPDNSIATISLLHELLWVMRTDHFTLKTYKTTAFNVSMPEAANVSVPAPFVPTAISESRKSGRPLYFKLKYDMTVRLEGWGEDRFHIYVVCDWIPMQFLNESTLIGGPTECGIEDYQD